MMKPAKRRCAKILFEINRPTYCRDAALSIILKLFNLKLNFCVIDDNVDKFISPLIRNITTGNQVFLISKSCLDEADQTGEFFDSSKPLEYAHQILRNSGGFYCPKLDRYLDPEEYEDFYTHHKVTSSEIDHLIHKSYSQLCSNIDDAHQFYLTEIDNHTKIMTHTDISEFRRVVDPIRNPLTASQFFYGVSSDDEQFTPISSDELLLKLSFRGIILEQPDLEILSYCLAHQRKLSTESLPFSCDEHHYVDFGYADFGYTDLPIPDEI